MRQPRYQRRKEERPQEITEAAFAAFAEKGFGATKVEEVARRAGVSKGLLYRYFETKEELFKAVIRSFVSPKVAELEEMVRTSELSAEAFLRGPFLAFAQSLPRSPARILVRLMIAEGPKHPDLTAYYWENVIEHGLAALSVVIRRGVENGEFRHSALDEFPQLLVTPVLFSVTWSIVFQKHQRLDTDRMIEAHIDLVLRAIRADGNEGKTS